MPLGPQFQGCVSELSGFPWCWPPSNRCSAVQVSSLCSRQQGRARGWCWLRPTCPQSPKQTCWCSQGPGASPARWASGCGHDAGAVGGTRLPSTGVPTAQTVSTGPCPVSVDLPGVWRCRPRRVGGESTCPQVTPRGKCVPSGPFTGCDSTRSAAALVSGPSTKGHVSRVSTVRNHQEMEA